MSTTINATGVNFIASGVKIGDELKVTSGTFTIDASAPSNFKLLIANIIDADSVTYDVYDSNGTLIPSPAIVQSGTINYKIVHTYSKDEQVDTISNYAKAFNNKRVIVVWPGSAIWDDEDSNEVTLDGSVVAAALAAAASAYPAQQSFTNLSFAGPKKLLYSNRYFTPSQLKKLAENGVMVFVQTADGAPISAMHQKTTSTTSIQEQEFSITKAVDKVSIDLYALVKPFLGKYNVTQDLLTQLEGNLTKYLFNAKNIKAPYCGGLIIGYKDLVLRANLEGKNQDLNPGTVEISLNVEVGYPFNYAPIKIFVQ